MDTLDRVLLSEGVDVVAWYAKHGPALERLDLSPAQEAALAVLRMTAWEAARERWFAAVKRLPTEELDKLLEVLRG